LDRFATTISRDAVMKTKLLMSATALALATIAPASHAALGDLSLVNYVTYGDGQSFSLPIAELICGQNFGGAFNGVDCGTYRVASTPGNIKDLVVIATGAEGGPVTTNFSGMDNAYSTPSGVNGSIFFTPESNTDGVGTSRGFQGTIANNGESTWDSSLAALKTFLAGDAPIFFFNNNQVNSGATTNQNLGAWARLSITDDQNQLVDLDPLTAGVQTLVFANRTRVTGVNTCEGGIGSPAPYAIVPQGGGCPSPVDPDNFSKFNDQAGQPDPVFGDNTATDYVLSGGAVCLGPAPLFAPVPCSGPHAFGPINHNLGADTVAYAIIFPELTAALNALFANQNIDLSQYTFHLDLRLGCELTGDPDNPTCTGRSLNNGYEQLFLGTTAQVTDIPVPAPGTLALLGGVLALLGLRRRFG
jgi:hypothetical protein